MSGDETRREPAGDAENLHIFCRTSSESRRTSPPSLISPYLWTCRVSASRLAPESVPRGIGSRGVSRSGFRRRGVPRGCGGTAGGARGRRGTGFGRGVRRADAPLGGAHMSPSASGSSGPPTAGVDGRWWRDTVSGATAGMISVLALHPLDVIKTRLQVQDGIDRRAATYRGTVHAFRTVVRSEGALGLYAGLSPAVIGSTLSWAAYFGCYNNAKQRYAAMFEVEHLPSHLHLLSAAEAGLVVSLATNPIWVAKTRLQLQRREPSRAPEGGGARTAGGAPPPRRTAGSSTASPGSRARRASRGSTAASPRASSSSRTARCSLRRTRSSSDGGPPPPPPGATTRSGSNRGAPQVVAPRSPPRSRARGSASPLRYSRPR